MHRPAHGCGSEASSAAWTRSTTVRAAHPDGRIVGYFVVQLEEHQPTPRREQSDQTVDDALEGVA